MHVSRFCHKLLSKTSLHKARLQSVSATVETIILSKSIAVTQVGRKIRNGNQSHEKSNCHYASAREAWLIISSIEDDVRHSIKAYQFRISIEEKFRDTKSGRYGLGLKMTYLKQKKRYRFNICKVNLRRCFYAKIHVAHSGYIAILNR